MVGRRARGAGFIRENALADPRVKYVPELEEERYQSLLAVPIVGRSGEAIGAITAHTEAPREFTDDEVDFIVTSASLVASAIENARLYEETRLRVVSSSSSPSSPRRSRVQMRSTSCWRRSP